ncbi:hypothetical protein AeRB84_013461 [Aphanomyces euteiches]|nr:hypothetical protein AeRB84_013461 [Aphanomyces euteiches]
MESARDVWYVVVEGQGYVVVEGQGYVVVEGQGRLSQADKVVNFSTTKDIADLRRIVHGLNPRKLSSYDASDLQVYANKAAYDRNDDPLEEDERIKDYGRLKKDALLVVAPALQVPQIPQVQPMSRGFVNYSLPTTDGINPLSACFDREAILNRMYKSISGEEDRNRFLLLNSPAASGKTSLLQMFQCKYQTDDLVIHYVSMRVSGDPWLSLIEVGLNYWKQKCRYEKHVIYILDDAQCIYDKQMFWSALFKVSRIYFGVDVRFIISATHVITFGEDSSPPEFRQQETIGRDDLLLSIDQAFALLDSNAPLGLQSSLQNYFELKKTIVEHCNGLIGALCKSVFFMVIKFVIMCQVKENVFSFSSPRNYLTR